MTDAHGTGAVQTPETPATGSANGEFLVRAEGVWKIFGPRADDIIGTPDADLSRAELREKTGCVIAVRDVTTDIKPGEMFVVMGLSGSGKSTLIRTLMTLTNEQQEQVAKAIAGDKVPPDKAGQDWVDDNQKEVQSWLENG
jgi:ABC-type glutathione transport system ATPase component